MTKWKEPGIGELVTCETVSAIALHVRRITDRGVKLGGHAYPWPRAPCGQWVDWDSQIPVTAKCITCRNCKAEFTKVAK
jgi:hypothetical protein